MTADVAMAAQEKSGHVLTLSFIIYGTLRLLIIENFRRACLWSLMNILMYILSSAKRLPVMTLGRFAESVMTTTGHSVIRLPSVVLKKRQLLFIFGNFKGLNWLELSVWLLLSGVNVYTKEEIKNTGKVDNFKYKKKIQHNTTLILSTKIWFHK